MRSLLVALLSYSIIGTILYVVKYAWGFETMIFVSLVWILGYIISGFDKISKP